MRATTPMNAELLAALIPVYIVLAVIGSVAAAQILEKRFKATNPATRPYRWGFYLGCMGLACAPLAGLMGLGMVVAAARARWEVFGMCLAYTFFCLVQTVAGWFIIRRKRWAWVVGTVFSFNLIIWAINAVYGKNRWGEFVGEPYGSAGTVDEGYELLAEATRLETQGRVQEALLAYQRVADGYAETAAGHDARKSIESLRAKIG